MEHVVYSGRGSGVCREERFEEDGNEEGRLDDEMRKYLIEPSDTGKCGMGGGW